MPERGAEEDEVTVRFGEAELEYPSAQFGELRDSSNLLGGGDEMRARLDDDGYLFLRGLLPRDQVLRAQRSILEYMDERGALTPGKPVLEGVMPRDAKWVNLMNPDISHSDAVITVLESPDLFSLFRDLLDDEVRTYAYKWLRAVGNDSFTGCHYDVVYMGQGSQRVHTVWIPFADIPIYQGTLAICEGSHRLPGFQRLRETYGKIDVDRDRTEGWFNKDPREILDKFGGRWLTTEFRAGDILTFGLYTLHASTTNTTDRYRLSCDVRFQPASDPVDPRWVNKVPRHTRTDGPVRSMEEARAGWRI